MGIQRNSEGIDHAKNLIRTGKIDRESSWSFETEDENKILNEGGWSEYKKWFLAIDTEENEETKARYKFPYGKNGKVYRSGVIAAKQRAAQQGYDNILEVADELLSMIDTEKKEKTLQKIKVGMQFRSAEIRNQDIDVERRTVALSFSSEEPVERFFGIEILDHSVDSVDLTRLKRGGALLIDHDPKNQVGVIEEVYIDQADRKGRAVVRFGRSAKANEIFQDVLDGIRKNVSVGYVYLGEDALQLENYTNDKKPVYRVKKWQPIEISLVSIPADITVGIGREKERELVIEVPVPSLEGKTQEKTLNKEDKNMVEVENLKKEAIEAERKRFSEILALGEKFNCLDLAKRAIAENKTVEEFKLEILEKKFGSKKIESIDPYIGLTNKERQNFSIVRAINAMIERDWSKAPFEKECSDAVAQKLKRTPQGMFIPYDVMATRDLEKGTGSAGGYTVETTLLASEFIELLRHNLMVRKLGARVLGGLVGDIAIPKATGGATAYWVGENIAPTESQQTFGQLVMTPKTVGTFTDISRKLLLQSSIDVEAFVREDLARTVAEAIDYAAINGSGTSNQPRGILNTTGIGDVAIGANGGAPTYQHIVSLWKEIAIDNAVSGNMAFLTNAIMIAKLMSTPKVSGYPVYIIESLPDAEGITTILGMKCGMSNLVPANLVKGTSNDCSAIICGNWNDLIIAEWGALDILVDPYTGGAAGTVRVRVLQDIDIAIRHPESFAAIKDARDV